MKVRALILRAPVRGRRALGVGVLSLALWGAAQAAPVAHATRILYNSSSNVMGDKFSVAPGKSSYVVGEAITLQLTTRRPGNVYLFSVGPDGEVALLYPTRRYEATLPPGKLSLPTPDVGRFGVSGPAGTNRLLLVATNAPLPLDQLVRPSQNRFGLHQLQGSTVGWLQGRLRALLSGVDQGSWSASTVSWTAAAPAATPPVTRSGPGFWQSTFATRKTLAQLREQYVAQLRAQGFAVVGEQGGSSRADVALQRRDGKLTATAVLRLEMLAGGKARVTILTPPAR